ncbi:acanthoscurrin-1-like [Xenia sp. Carnegie-2017]|uniref:acanthoscurrin-1-like n=1 Tax=Xenia sp. Carnegie-2017 TaxID=2897299 RepID=UPI001F0425B6|nr:acanthoscurrin-1-like [Xenia sp. Carnegie-2017]
MKALEWLVLVCSIFSKWCHLGLCIPLKIALKNEVQPCGLENSADWGLGPCSSFDTGMPALHPQTGSSPVGTRWKMTKTGYILDLLKQCTTRPSNEECRFGGCESFGNFFEDDEGGGGFGLGGGVAGGGGGGMAGGGGGGMAGGGGGGMAGGGGGGMAGGGGGGMAGGGGGGMAGGGGGMAGMVDDGGGMDGWMAGGGGRLVVVEGGGGMVVVDGGGGGG